MSELQETNSNESVPSKSQNIKRTLKSWSATVIVFLVTVAVMQVVLYFIRFPTVDGNSMSPTYDDNEQVVMIYTKSVHVNDVVIAWSSYLDEYIIKRVVGMPGDHIVINDIGLYRNDKLVTESYISIEDWAVQSDHIDIVVPEGELFLMGDNRTDSTDSRVIGPIPIDDVFGKVICENPMFSLSK